MRYNITDSQGNLVRGGFTSYQAAFTFLISRGRYDWIINSKNTSNYDKSQDRSWHRNGGFTLH